MKAYVLRYWESEFRWMAPQKSRSKQRLYRRRDIEMILLIKKLLYEQRFTIAGARKKLRELGVGRALERARLLVRDRPPRALPQDPRRAGPHPRPALSSGGVVRRGRERIDAARGACARAGLARAVAGWLAAGLAAASAHAANCDPWPGEPSPLPAIGDPDPVRAEWASLRAKELSQWARRAEREEDPVRARQMWRRLICLDPSNDEALAGVQRARGVIVHRPKLVEEDRLASRGADPFAALDAPLGLAPDAKTVSRETRSEDELRELRSAVGALDQKVRTAQFEQALAIAPGLRSRLARAPAGGTRTSLIAQTEVLAATAELALGRGEAADASLRRALAADPALALDPSTTAPKVLRALAAARSGAEP